MNIAAKRLGFAYGYSTLPPFIHPFVFSFPLRNTRFDLRCHSHQTNQTNARTRFHVTRACCFCGCRLSCCVVTSFCQADDRRVCLILDNVGIANRHNSSAFPHYLCLRRGRLLHSRRDSSAIREECTSISLQKQSRVKSFQPA